MADEDRKCSREGCQSKLPPGTEIPEGWTVARVEEYARDQVRVYYVYVCPNDFLTASEKQGLLFENEVSR